MKKLLGIMVLSLLFCNVAKAISADFSIKITSSFIADETIAITSLMIADKSVCITNASQLDNDTLEKFNLK